MTVVKTIFLISFSIVIKIICGMDKYEEDKKNNVFYLGSYNPAKVISQWIYNENDRSCTILGAYNSQSSPSWLSYSSKRIFLFAVDESDNLVSSYFVSHTTGELVLINSVSSAGGSPAHISVDPYDRFLLVSNYNNGVLASIPISETGMLSSANSLIQHIPAKSSHIHESVIYKNFVSIIDLGLDTVTQYRLSDSGVLSSSPSLTITMPIGTGPRHMEIHPTAPIAIVINELGNSLTVIPFNKESGILGPLSDFSTSTVSTLPSSVNSNDITMGAGEIMISSNGEFVYASNRDKLLTGRSSISVFRFDSNNYKLHLIQTVSSLGDYPRYFKLLYNDKHLLLGNQITNNLVSFLVEKKTGLIDEKSAVSTNNNNSIQPTYFLF